MTCGTLIEFCNEDFPIPPRLPPPPPILSYYFEDNKLNSSFYCDFCSNLEASLDPLKEFENSDGGAMGGLLSPSQNLTVILLIVAAVSAAVGSAVTVVWKKWFRCQDGGILSKAFGTSHSSHSADISTTPDGRRRSRTASLGSGSALQNLQKRLSSSSFISRRSIYPPHSNIISNHTSHLRSGTMSNNTYCECPSSMMMMICTDSTNNATGGNNLNAPVTSPNSTNASLSSSLATQPSAPTEASINSGGNVYAELDPVQQQSQMVPPHMVPGLGLTNGPTPANQYILNQRRRPPAPLPPIPTSVPGTESVHDSSILANNVLNLSSNGAPPLQIPNIILTPLGIMSPQLNSGDNQMEMNNLNDIYYSDLDCKQIQF